LVAVVEVGGLLGPIDGQVGLPDLVEGFGGVLQDNRPPKPRCPKVNPEEVRM
jgi:hypothetical protein